MKQNERILKGCDFWLFFQNLKKRKQKKTKEKNPKKTQILIVVLGILCVGFVCGGSADSKQVSVGVNLSECRLIPSGQAVGMRLKTKGVMVVGVEQGNLPAKKSGLKNGDIIIKVNDVTLQNTRHFEEILKAVGEQTVALQVLREHQTLTVNLTPQRNQANQLVCGMWLRDSAAGIGTITFFTEDKQTFAALGHPVNDSDTEQTYDVRLGQVELVEIKGAKKAEKNRAGELIGVLSDIAVGTISKNTPTGLVGTVKNKAFIQKDALPIATKREVKLGKATILSTVSEQGCFEYDIEILKILDGRGNRDFIIRVTDENLIAQTGGIVQGMSGSPILQNGRIIGAVTHVLVNDSTRGYGISIEKMLADEKG